nr:hypothetical protein BaRGS_029718 [Batillaria attramentaria]
MDDDNDDDEDDDDDDDDNDDDVDDDDDDTCVDDDSDVDDDDDDDVIDADDDDRDDNDDDDDDDDYDYDDDAFRVDTTGQDNGGIRVAASKDVKMLSGVAQDYLKKFQTMFDSYTVLLVSEDVSVLRTLASAASANEAGDDDNDNLVDDAHDNDADDETQSAENLLMSAESESK